MSLGFHLKFSLYQSHYWVSQILPLKVHSEIIYIYDKPFNVFNHSSHSPNYCSTFPKVGIYSNSTTVTLLVALNLTKRSHKWHYRHIFAQCWNLLNIFRKGLNYCDRIIFLFGGSSPSVWIGLLSNVFFRS